jgi:GntR family transcriptional regulator
VGSFDFRQPCPKYAQIADIFRQRISRGIWAQGLRLPANEELAIEFGVSRVTIRQAVDLLARDGIIEARQGRGTFITGTLKQDRWLKVETTLSDLAEVTRTSPEYHNISESRADARCFEDGKAAAHYVLCGVALAHARHHLVISIYPMKDISKIPQTLSQGNRDSDFEGYA